MAETLHRSSDVPNFDSYPANQPESEGLHQQQQTRTALEERASQVGSTVGKVVVMLRKTQDRLKDAATETGGSAASRIGDLADNARAKAQDAATRISEMAKARTQEWTDAASSRVDEFRQAAAEKTAEVKSQVRTGYYRARLRANAVARDYPMHVVLAAGAAGFLLGVGLRIWRANREYRAY